MPSPEQCNRDIERALRARIRELEDVIIRYLADDFSCNGGAQRMFEAVMKEQLK